MPLADWLSYRAKAKTVTLRLIAGYDDAYAGFNFNGYGKGQALVQIPLGWRVEVHCVNHSSSMSHSCAIVRGVRGRAPVFPGASSPDAQAGVLPGHTVTFSFSAVKEGSYRIACLVPGHEQEGMWDAFDVTHGRLPTVVLLRR